MILVLDNYDSFTFNLVQYLGELGAEPVVYRNDALTVDAALALAPRGIVVSPGPGRPGDAGISVPLIRAATGRVPVLGVCLGHQAIAEACGGRLSRATRLLHGKTSAVAHDGTGVFASIPTPLEAMRYHSLLVEPSGCPAALIVNAWTEDPDHPREIMGFRHAEHPLHGVQFHPESIGTGQGRAVLANFLRIVENDG